MMMQQQQREENIYNLIPREQVQYAKPPKHKSKFGSDVRDEAKSNKAPNKTMGPAKVETRAPNDFMKAHDRESRKPLNASERKGSFHYADEDRRKPAVPKQDDKPVMGIKTTKNFITQNAVENIMSVPRKPEKNFCDTRKGDKQALTPSGMEPKYIHKKEFGEVPQYLVNRKQEMAEAQAQYDAYVSERLNRGGLKHMPQAERMAILDGLKANWEYLHHEYQGLSVVTDTAPKKNRKERMEAEMKQLERDIELIEKHSIIYIAN